jgi:hypothetical protein
MIEVIGWLLVSCAVPVFALASAVCAVFAGRIDPSAAGASSDRSAPGPPDPVPAASPATHTRLTAEAGIGLTEAGPAFSRDFYPPSTA